VAYLEAWSRVAPNDTNFMSVLAEQYARSGRLDDAETMLERMLAVKGQDLTGQILRTRIEIAQQRAYAAQPDSPERAERLAHDERPAQGRHHAGDAARLVGGRPADAGHAVAPGRQCGCRREALPRTQRARPGQRGFL
jgi:pentatricopeptide repeat protein